MTERSKEVQQKFKENEEAAMDDLWVNRVLVKKAGDTNIKGFPIPDQWEPPTVKGGQPNFTELDNPGDWPECCYCPSFKKDGMYEGYNLPTGATPVPISIRKQTMNGWDFLQWLERQHQHTSKTWCYKNQPFSPFKKGFSLQEYS